MAGKSHGERNPLHRIESEGGTRPASAQRRGFLKKGLFATGGAMLSGLSAAALATDAGKSLPPDVPQWERQLGPGVDDRPYGRPSKFESSVIRRNVPWLTATTTSSVSFTPLQDLRGMITPNGLVFERYHAGRATVDPHQHRLMIHGLVERPLMLTMDDLMRFPSVSRVQFLECAANGGMEWRGAQLNSVQFTHGMLSCCEWTGVPLSTLLDEVGVKDGAKWILAEGADGASMDRSIPLDKARDDVLVAYAQNGEALRPEQGYPVRLIVPGWEANICVKWLRRLKLGTEPWYTREETSKYTDLMPDGRAREFTWVMEAKSVITFPCPEKPLQKHGLYEIEGLAWSGHGKVKRVDVSTDGGVNWRPARLRGLVLPKALTRFGIEWRWDGKPALLQSRVVDETGYVQPTIAQLRALRGVNSIYHNNSIQTWQLDADGSVNNVQLG
jgi:sulfane dehydrogenase subunit SoxC